jgi:hypothetical protein
VLLLRKCFHLECGVDKPKDEVKLLVLQHGLVPRHVARKLLAQSQPRRLQW